MQLDCFAALAMTEKSLTPDQALVSRFSTDLDRLVPASKRTGIAVSGGPDSLALLLLAAAARPGLIEAATVDHGLRPEGRSEAEMVERICQRLGVPHRILSGSGQTPGSNLQAWARTLRYQLLGDWAVGRGLQAVATGHHLEDQAETLLMRLARGSGVAGLGGVQRRRSLRDDKQAEVDLVRPLLDWPRGELRRIVGQAGLEPVDDPSNSDEKFDRSRARALLDSVDWLEPDRLASVARNCRDSERALDWTARNEFDKRRSESGAGIALDPSGLPRELRRRLLIQAIETLGGETPPGPKLAAALDAVEEGGTTTLAGVKIEGGAIWRLSTAPPRRR
jgi:tRNA(Ile)-lysidine synthase